MTKASCIAHIVFSDEHSCPMQAPKTHKSWPIALIAELHYARYLLQSRALELFLSDRSSALLSFKTPKVCCSAAQPCIISCARSAS